MINIKKTIIALVVIIMTVSFTFCKKEKEQQDYTDSAKPLSLPQMIP